MEKPTLVAARLNDKSQPAHRARYEKPLDELLKEKALGSVEGGGSQLDGNGEVAYCEISIALRSAEPAALQAVIAALEKLGAPKGSKLLVGPGSEVPFGGNEGLAFYFDNVSLPSEVYATHDINDVLERFGQALDGVGAMHSFMNGERETAVYIYGPSFERMKSALAPIADRHPLCKGARIVKCA
jgi:hypothetical protein